MNARKTLILASALSLVVAVLEAAQPAEDTSAGTWKLNIAKSTFASNAPPKSETRTYTVTPDRTHVVIEDEYADGKTMKMFYVINRPDGTSVSTLSVFERQ